MLEGKTVNLRVVEKDDLPLLQEWWNSLEFTGMYNPVHEQKSKADVEKDFEQVGSGGGWFLMLKKDGTKIGEIAHFNVLHPISKILEIGYSVIPSERGKGYCTEAAQILVDYLFLSKETSAIQATTHFDNVASQGVLRKVGFKKEGIMRKRAFIRGEWTDMVLFSILREEWKEPKILTGTV